MAPNSILFGTTVLAIAKENSVITRNLMRIYNETKAFHNDEDTATNFIDALKESFSQVETEVIGGVLKFVAHS